MNLIGGGGRASLILVRHAMPAFSPDVPADEWTLSAEGLAAAQVLAGHLPAGARLVASTEPKAYQTLEPAGPVLRDGRFAEVRREGEPWDGPFRELRRSYVSGVDHAGWEPRSAVAARFEAGVREHLAAANGQPLVVASHGMAMTVWLSTRLGLPDPGQFWADLRFPDAIWVDPSRADPSRPDPPVLHGRPRCRGQR